MIIAYIGSVLLLCMFLWTLRSIADNLRDIKYALGYDAGGTLKNDLDDIKHSLGSIEKNFNDKLYSIESHLSAIEIYLEPR